MTLLYEELGWIEDVPAVAATCHLRDVIADCAVTRARRVLARPTRTGTMESSGVMSAEATAVAVGEKRRVVVTDEGVNPLLLTVTVKT